MSTQQKGEKPKRYWGVQEGKRMAAQENRDTEEHLVRVEVRILKRLEQ